MKRHECRFPERPRQARSSRAAVAGRPPYHAARRDASPYRVDRRAISTPADVKRRSFFCHPPFLWAWRYSSPTLRQACGLTGLDVPATLRAYLIVSEDKRKAFSPDNALCLSATYASAFKEHLISFDEDNRMILSPALREHATSEIFHHTFKTYEGAHMRTALRFQPSAKLLAQHRERLAS